MKVQTQQQQPITSYPQSPEVGALVKQGLKANKDQKLSQAEKQGLRREFEKLDPSEKSQALAALKEVAPLVAKFLTRAALGPGEQKRDGAE